MTESAREIRRNILMISQKGGDGNLQSCFSSVDIINYVFREFNVGATRVHESKNFFVLSKGQSNLTLLTVLAYYGYINIEELDTFCQFGSKYSMQSDRTKVSNIIFSAGSLGHGICQAVGLAYGLKLKKSKQKLICLVGDGELNEGTVWEALLFASSECLNNFIVVVDDNKSITEMIDLKDIKSKFSSFGFDVYKCDGNNEVSISSCFKKITYDKPSVIIANTRRGYGSETLENDKSWFHRAPTQYELDFLLKEVESHA